MAEEKDKPAEKFSAFDEAVSYGAMYDKLNIKNLTFWTVMGIGVLLIVVMGVISLYNYNKFQFQQSASIESEFPEYQRIQNMNMLQLNTYGVVDEETGVYRIPVDSAITLMLNNGE
ncbi:MAG: hypothetical protein WD491_03680 [Balneolales bacterium]